MKISGRSALLLPVLLTNLSHGIEDDYFLDPLATDVPHVLSAVRLKQPAAEVPASVTVLDADFIAATGAKTITELLRFVPGMMVAPEIYDNNDSVQYHGGPVHFPKGMQVLLDGHSVYGSVLNSMNWYQIPVAVEQIQRIEVVRGPNAPTYGTNAYQAVINIITRHAADAAGTQVTLEGGDNRYRYGFAQAGWGTDNHHWSLSALHRSTDNLEDLYSETPPCNPCSDNRRASAVSLRSDHDLSALTTLKTSLYMGDALKQVPSFNETVTDNTVTDRSIMGGLTIEHTASPSHQIRLSTSVMHSERLNDIDIDGIPAGALDDDLRALFLLNPEAAMALARGDSAAALEALDLTDPQQLALATALAIRYADFSTATTPVSGKVKGYLIEDRIDIELQDTWAISDRLIFVGGLGYRYQNINSEHYLGGSLDSHNFRAFANANWKPSQSWLTHAGLMYEREDDREEALSVRAAVNYLFDQLHSFRFVFSEAARTPDYFEEYAEWTFQLKDIETTADLNGDTYFESFIGPGDLDQQRIRSYELGFYGRSEDGRADTDIRLFREYQYDVIYRWPSTRNADTYTDNEIWYTGIEGQASWQPLDATRLRFNGAYTELTYDLEDGLTEERIFALYAPLTLTTTWMQSWPWQLHTTTSLILGYNYGDKHPSEDATDMKRLDFHLYRPARFAGMQGKVSLRGQRDFSADPYLPGSLAHNSVFRWQAGINLEF